MNQIFEIIFGTQTKLRLVFRKCAIILIINSFSVELNGQTNSSINIAPNVKFSYDSIILEYKYKFNSGNYENLYTNYLFTSEKLLPRKITSFIGTRDYTLSNDMFSTDSLMKLAIDRVDNLNIDTISSVCEAIRIDYKNFHGYGKIFKFKTINNTISIYFYCERIFDGKIYSVFYSSSSSSKSEIKDYNLDKTILYSIIDGLNLPPNSDKSKNHDPKLSDIHISVDSLRIPEKLKTLVSYYGKVNVENLSGVIQEVLVPGQFEELSFFPEMNGDIFITTFYFKTGWIDLNCKLKVQGVNGEIFYVPFTFRYYNK